MASFRKRGSKWEYRIRYVDRRTGKSKETSKGGFKTKKEAQSAALTAEQEVNYFGFSENGKEVVNNYINEWLETYKKPFVKPITYTLQERIIRLNIVPRWGHYKLQDITRKEYQQWINELRDSYSEGTTIRIHSVMNSSLDDAVHEFNILRDNPAKKIKVPKDNGKNEELKYFSVEELEKFLTSLKTPRKKSRYPHSIQYYVLFSLMAKTGIRIGEALALTWEDIDLDSKMLSVNKTLVYPLNSTPYISTPKSKSSSRTIKIGDDVVRLLKRHRINRKEMYLLYHNYNSPDTNIIFHQHEGRWLKTNVVRDYFKYVCKSEGLPVLSPHAFRHTHAVHLLEAGANIKYVSERLGHASVKITADTYLHITEKIENDALDMYQRYMEK